MVAGGFDAESTALWLREGLGDLTGFGLKFIAKTPVCPCGCASVHG
jgi:hypothetical protein